MVFVIQARYWEILIFAQVEEVDDEQNGEPGAEVLLSLCARDHPLAGGAFLFAQPGDVVMSFLHAGLAVKSLHIQKLNVQTMDIFHMVRVVGSLGENFELWDREKYGATIDADIPEPEDDKVMTQWIMAGMASLGAKKREPKTNGKPGGKSRNSDGAVPAENYIEVSEAEESKDEVRVLDSDEDKLSDAEPRPPKPEPKPEPREPPPPRAADDHVFIWLTRTNRQATCGQCRERILKGNFRCVFSPHPSDLGPDRRWSTILWRYYHLDRACLSVLIPKLRAAHEGRLLSGTSANASFLDARGWVFRVDVAPLPRASGETEASRAVAIEEATHLLNSEFAAASAAIAV